MDLGISGRTAIVCASSRGLGGECARERAGGGCRVVTNGRDKAALDRPATEIRAEPNAAVTPVAADAATPGGQAPRLGAAPPGDILISNSGGPPFRDFRQV